MDACGISLWEQASPQERGRGEKFVTSKRWVGKKLFQRFSNLGTAQTSPRGSHVMGGPTAVTDAHSTVPRGRPAGLASCRTAASKGARRERAAADLAAGAMLPDVAGGCGALLVRGSH